MSDNDRTVFVNFEKEEMDAHVKELDSLYLKLGKAYYEGAFEDPLPQLLPLFDQITGLRAKAEESRQNERENICPNCGAKLQKDAKFCGKCGCRVG